MKNFYFLISSFLLFSCAQVKKHPDIQQLAAVPNRAAYAVAPPVVTTVIPASVIVEDSMHMFTNYLEKAAWSKPSVITSISSGIIVQDDLHRFVTKLQIAGWDKAASTTTTFKSSGNIEFTKLNDSTYQVSYVIKQLTSADINKWTSAQPMTFVFNTDDKHLYFRMGTVWSMLWSN